MRIDALLIASFGSSMYGATRPELSIAKIARIVSSASIVPDSLIAVSPGGDRDFGENAMFDDSRAIIERLAREAGVRYISFDTPDLEASIAARLSLYEERAGGRAIRCFVNIGGASPNSGTSSYTLDFPQGLVLDPPRIPTTADRGLVYEYAARGIPVVNLLNVRSLAEKGGLPYDPIPLPKPGEGGVYADERYSAAIAIATLVVSIGLLAIGVIQRRKIE
jgi:poly-gamma-glutamate system protein